MRALRLIRRSARRADDVLTRASSQVAYAVNGIEGVNEKLLRTTRPDLIAAILRDHGAQVGEDCILHGPLVIHNAAHDYSNLVLGRHVHLGRGCILDLTDRIVIEDEACVSMGCTILTHRDIGSRPLSAAYPRDVAEARIGFGAYLGANVTLMHGCAVGALAVVAAGGVVIAAVESRTIVAGVPAVPKGVVELEAESRSD